MRWALDANFWWLDIETADRLIYMMDYIPGKGGVVLRKHGEEHNAVLIFEGSRDACALYLQQAAQMKPQDFLMEHLL